MILLWSCGGGSGAGNGGSSETTDFSASPSSGDVPLIVDFTDLSTGTITAWEWDLDGDGVVDATEQNPSAEYDRVDTYSVTLTVYRASGPQSVTKADYINVDYGPPVKTTIDDNFDGADAVHAADLDGDGDIDVLGTAWNADEVAWWQNEGGSFDPGSKQSLDHPYSSPHIAHAVDLDDDDDMDVIGCFYHGGEIVWWGGNGQGSFGTAQSITTSFQGAHAVYAADLDGDNDLDVLGAAKDENSICWWENTDGQGSFTFSETIEDNFSGAVSVHAADLDGDGDLDVVGAAATGDEIAWWENTDGEGTFHSGRTVDDALTFTTVSQSKTVFAADLDNDGCEDIIGAANESNEVAWWKIVP